MNTFEEGKCRRCGAGIPPRSTESLCPACLMSGALESPISDAKTLPLAGEPHPQYRYSEFPQEFGGYLLLGLLGRGGMATVYEAEQIATGRRVALKMLGQQLDSTDLRKRFLREGRLAARVNHPNSLYIFGSEEIEGVPVITMEIAGAGTLKDKLDKRGPLPVNEAVDAILDVIAGLEAAFSDGVLHRDIKPSNCFVYPDGSVKVGDFGLSVSTLAKDDSYVTATGVIMGTPAYAPPEQLRGDDLDARADIYSVGATLFTLLTGEAPFTGKNAVQVVTNVVNVKPKPIRELRKDLPPNLERVVARCLAKEPDGRYGDYAELRDALLPFSSREPEPASMKLRVPAGWIDYLIAFLVPYVVLMLYVGNEEFHLGLFMERTLFSARYHIALLSFAFLYFGIAEGIWGAGIGKRLKGLQVVQRNGRPPGIGRALMRILIPILCVEGVRIPFSMAMISATRIDDLTWPEVAFFTGAYCICPWIPALLALRARPENGFATAWDLASGTKVVVRPKGTERPSMEPIDQPVIATDGTHSIGPYQIIREILPATWIAATDPVLRRQVWLLRRNSMQLSNARRNLARPGRLRWLQEVETADATWDAFEATQGVPLSSLVEGGKRVPWSTLRHWLHELATELWAASGGQTLPAELSLDHVWITARGTAIVLDEAWPAAKTPAERFSVADLAGQQRFLNAVATCVKSTSLPLHARPVLQNLEDGKFEKLSFLTGTLRGHLDKPSEVSRGIRAGSIFVLPLYIWIMLFVGTYTGEGAMEWFGYDSAGWIAMITAMLVLGGSALLHFVELPFGRTLSHSIFRLAIVDSKGARAGISTLFLRWAIVWLPLLLPMSVVALLAMKAEYTAAFISAHLLLLLWLSAAVYAVIHPHRGLHDRLAGTWVVRH